MLQIPKDAEKAAGKHDTQYHKLNGKVALTAACHDHDSNEERARENGIGIGQQPACVNHGMVGYQTRKPLKVETETVDV